MDLKAQGSSTSDNIIIGGDLNLSVNSIILG